MADIKIIHGLLGRTIVEASAWEDGESMSLKLDNGAILQVSALSPLTRRGSARLHYEIEFSLCSQGIHSWCDSTEVFPVDYRCEWCGEEYGNVKDNHMRLGYTDPNDPDLIEEAAASEEQSLDYFNKYIAGDRR